MARMHSRKRGKAKSTRPIGRPQADGTPSGKDVEKLVLQLAKDRKNATQIGLLLRSEHNVPDVKAATGKRVSQILAEAGVTYELPDDLLALVKKAVLIRKHLAENHLDQPAKRGLTLTESKIRRLVKYYKATGAVKQSWNYNPKEASYLAE